LKAFLRVIREGESNQDDSAYTLINGGGHFSSFADHPFAGMSAPPGRAAGAYQDIPHTWQRILTLIGPGDFSPPRQDEGNAALILALGAGPAIEAGDLQEAMRILAPTWVSLPGLGLERARRVFQQYGGTIASATQPAAPIEERSTDLAPTPEGNIMGVAIPLLTALIPQVLQLFSGRAQAQIAKATGADPQVAAQFMQNLITQIGQVAGIPVVDNTSATQAVAAVTTLPPPKQAEAVSTLEDHALDYLDKIAPMLDRLADTDKARWQADAESAAAAGARWNIKGTTTLARMLSQAALLIFALATCGVVGVMAYQVYRSTDGKPDGILVGLLTILVYAAARIAESPFRFIFGGVSDSQAGDAGATVIRSTVVDKKTVTPSA